MRDDARGERAQGDRAGVAIIETPGIGLHVECVGDRAGGSYGHDVVEAQTFADEHSWNRLLLKRFATDRQSARLHIRGII